MLLFGEEVRILGEEADYFLIENTFDAYQGYVPKMHIAEEAEGNSFFVQDDFLRISFRQGSVLLPKGSRLIDFDGTCFTYQGHKLTVPPEARILDFATAIFSVQDLLKNAKSFVGTPYLWGGRTRFGIDCSGFVQLLFKEMGIALKRDAKQQVLQGNAVDTIADAKAGDLAFFANLAGVVTHVGLLDGNGEIIHSSGQVRVDSVDEKGIYNAELNRYTHDLCAIRRYV
jgi:cell wall-associated NlpC family hydrolase